MTGTEILQLVIALVGIVVLSWFFWQFVKAENEKLEAYRHDLLVTLQDIAEKIDNLKE